MITESGVKVKNGYKLRGLEPPDLVAYDATTRKLFWSWVVELGLKRKDKELSQGLDKDGKPLRAISAYTREHRKSAMTPSGKGDPAAPPLTPAHQKSRTRSLLAGRAFSTHAEFFWLYDAWTGASWAVVLSYQAAKGRDVFGLSKAGVAWVKSQAWAKWKRWKEGKVRAVPQSRPRQVAAPQFDQRFIEHIEHGVSTGTGDFMPGRSTGFSTPEERRKYFSQTADAKLPGRAANPKSPHPLVGPKYNRILSHVWGKGGGAAPGRSGPKVPRSTPKPPPKTPKPAAPVTRLPKTPPKPPVVIAPPPPAPKPPGPSGRPVRDALVNQTKGKTNAAVAATLDAISKVHGDGQLPTIPIDQSSGGRQLGVFRYYPIGNKAVDIRVSSASPHPRNTTAHEIGHFLDNSGIPRGILGREFDKEPQFKEWFDAVNASQAVLELKALKTAKTMPFTRDDGTTGTYLVNKKHVAYLLEHKEIWARSYAQYIAHKSEDPVMRQELDTMRSLKTGYSSAQWAHADFEPIAKAMDALFASLGWIK
jgi:hypothetical protein